MAVSVAQASLSTLLLPTSSCGVQRQRLHAVQTSPGNASFRLQLANQGQSARSSCSSLPACLWKKSWQGKAHLGGQELSHVTSATLGQQGRGGRGVVVASLLGVGAPEALVIGVVALLVFGPKGLAEVARNLGKTLRTFQPTIRELQDVSREFRSTLEQEIGLDEIRNPYRENLPPPPPPPAPAPAPATAATSSPATSTPTPAPTSSAETAKTEAPSVPPTLDASEAAARAPAPKAYSAEDYARVTAEQAKSLVPEEARRAAEAAAWGGSPPPKQAAPETKAESSAPEAATPKQAGPESRAEPSAPQPAPKAASSPSPAGKAPSSDS